MREVTKVDHQTIVDNKALLLRSDMNNRLPHNPRVHRQRSTMLIDLRNQVRQRTLSRPQRSSSNSSSGCTISPAVRRNNSCAS